MLPAVQLPGTVDGLFTGLAGDTLAAHDAVRAAACRRSPLVAGCDRHRASPSRPLQSAIGLRNIKLTNDLMSGKRSAVSRPEIIQERALAAEQLKIIKPLTAVYTAALLKLFAAEAALLPRDMAPVPAPAEMPAREVSFDYVPR